jgi:hypothetical protein
MDDTHPPASSRLVRFAALACCLAAAHLTGQTGFGQKPGIKLRLPTGEAKSDAKALSESGPQFLAEYLLSNFSARVFVRGGAPMVVEYQLGNEAAATVTLTVKTKKDEQTFTRRLEPTGGEVKHEVFRLPEAFGKKPAVATLSVKAENKDPARQEPPDFEVYGLGMGEKAVGSMVIEGLSFQPGRVHATGKEKAAYSFHSRSDFPSARVEFRLTGRTPGGQLFNRAVGDEKIKRIRRGDSVSREWDGRNRKGEVSKGRHQLVVKAWYTEKKGGDWARASSRQRVLVE